MVLLGLQAPLPMSSPAAGREKGEGKEVAENRLRGGVHNSFRFKNLT